MEGSVADKNCESSGIRTTMLDVGEGYMDIVDVQRECLKELLGDGDLQLESGINAASLDLIGGASEIEDDRGVLRIVLNEDRTVNICFRGKVEE
nr:hypothetical protein LKV13_04730 [Borrelia sp. BU AG58]